MAILTFFFFSTQPEVLATGHLSPAADCYAFALLAAELLTGDKPYAGLPLGSIVYSVIYCHARPDLPPDTPPRYADLIRRCWAADPADRPTMADILADVRAQLRAAIAGG